MFWCVLPLQFNKETSGAAEFTSDRSENFGVANMSLSRSVFHWEEPKILIASGGGVVEWLVKEDTAKDMANRINLQQQQITVLAVTDGWAQQEILSVVACEL